MGFGRKRPSDAELLEYLFVTYRNRMYGIAFSILHDEMQAEDAVGDAFERLIPYLGRCRPGGKLAWRLQSAGYRRTVYWWWFHHSDA